jgi:hypothetical protein
MTRMNATAIFTTSSNNYFAFSRTLLESVRRYHADADLFFLLVDKTADERVAAERDLAAVVPVEEICIPDFRKMAFAYDVVELNTAVKPFFIDYLFRKGYKKVLYLDPDILVCGRLDAALDALTEHAIVLTPHQLSPTAPLSAHIENSPWELAALDNGIFNLGFLGVSNSPEGRMFIEWWSNRCRFLCYFDPGSGLFVDQKWVDLAPCYFPSTHILRHRGYNMSGWNLHDRKLENGKVNGSDPLVFYHFSSLDMVIEENITKHDPSLKVIDRPDIAALFYDYRRMVRENGYDYFRTIPYSYNFFADGSPIEILDRRLFAAVAAGVADPFAVPANRFLKTLRSVRRAQRGGKPVRGMRDLGKSFLRLICTLIGRRRYEIFVRSLKGVDRLRSHSFLLD